MKRILLLTILVLVLSVGPVFGAVGEPDANGKYPETDGKYSVVYNGGTAGNQYVILVLSSDLTAPPATGPSSMPSVSVDSIKYIDQAAADGQGKVTFENFIPMDRTKYNLVYISGQGMDVPKYVGYMDKAAGVSVSGNVELQGRQTISTKYSGVSATLYDGQSKIDTVISDNEGNYVFQTVPLGEYRLELKMPSYLKYTKNTLRVGGEVIVPLVTLKGGDVDGNGQIMMKDFTDLLSDYLKTGVDIEIPGTDIDGNGQVMMADLSLLLTNYLHQDTVVD